jgi:hypothetical protein
MVFPAGLSPLPIEVPTPGSGRLARLLSRVGLRRTLRPGHNVVVRVELGGFLAALGPGVHRLHLEHVFSSRRIPGDGSFAVASKEVSVTMVDSPWTATREGLRAEIDSPEPERRKRGWERFSRTAEVGRPPARVAAILAEAEATGSLGARRELRLEDDGCDCRIEGGVFSWQLKNTDLPAGGSTELDAQDVKQFCAALREGSPFGYVPFQRIAPGSPVSVTLWDEFSNEYSCKPIFESELRAHPAFRKWYEMTLDWRRRAPKLGS